MKSMFAKLLLTISAVLLIFGSLIPSYASAQSSTTVTNNRSVATAKSVDYKNEQAQRAPMPGWKTKALTYAFRYGGSALGNLIKKIPYKWADNAGDSLAKWGNTAANVVEELTEYGESSVTIALVSAGIPPADAQLIAKVIVFFLA